MHSQSQSLLPTHSFDEVKLQPYTDDTEGQFDFEKQPVLLQKKRKSRSRGKVLLSVLITFLLGATLFFFYQPDVGTTLRAAATGKAATPTSVDIHYESGEKAITNAKVAYSTLLTGSGFKDEGPMDDDVYFTSTRQLCYQILHAPKTRTSLNAPCVVLTTPNVRADKIERLKDDGITVIPVSFIESEWMKTNISTWQFVLSKLHLWTLTQYDLIAFFDTDHVLLQSMDGLFTDPAVVIKKNKKIPGETMPDEAPQPSEYLFASTAEMTKTHEYPPVTAPRDYYNMHYLEAGMFILRPDQAMFDHHMSILGIKDRFPPHLPEQNLFNYVFRHDGNMPWLQISHDWSSHFPFLRDIAKGAKSLHEKYWFPTHEEMRPLLLAAKDEMLAFYQHRAGQLVGEPAKAAPLSSSVTEAIKAKVTSMTAYLDSLIHKAKTTTEASSPSSSTTSSSSSSSSAAASSSSSSSSSTTASSATSAASTPSSTTSSS